jgi:hypothetical protein
MSEILKKLKRILLASGEGWKGGLITIDDLKEYINNDFSEAYKQFLNDNIIYRGDKNNFDIQYIIPGNRQSQNTLNYYTELFSNILESWKDFPKRNHSIICTNDYNKSTDYGGYSYIVFPKNGTKLGICPADDIWYSFNKFFEKISDSYFYLDDFNKVIYTILNAYDFDNIEEFIYNFKDITKETFIKDLFSTEEDINLYNLFYRHKNNLYKFLNTIFDPYVNDFGLIDIDDLIDVPDSREIWFDGDCIFINEKTYSENLIELSDW